MNKFFLFFFPFLLYSMPFGYWWIDDIIYLKKDYPVIYKIHYKNKIHILKFRWTLFKNKGIVVFYNFDNHNYQNILYEKTQLNGFKKFIRHNNSPNSPYFMIYFRGYKDKIAKFEFLVYNPESNILLDINEPRYRNKNFVKKLKPLYQKQFEKEIKPF